MTLPTEIDQDVRCPECGAEMVMGESGYWLCSSRKCYNGSIGPKTIDALRNQLPPGHVAIPTHDLEALRYEVGRYGSDRSDVIGAAQEVLRHLPAKKPDHVERIRLMIEFRREQLASNDYARTARERILHEIAALEAAIEWGKKLGEKP